MSQVAKDVTCFLRFAAEPWHDERKKLGLKMFMLLGIVTTAFAFYFKKGASSVQQARVQFVPKAGERVLRGLTVLGEARVRCVQSNNRKTSQQWVPLYFRLELFIAELHMYI